MHFNWIACGMCVHVKYIFSKHPSVTVTNHLGVELIKHGMESLQATSLFNWGSFHDSFFQPFIFGG